MFKDIKEAVIDAGAEAKEAYYERTGPFRIISESNKGASYTVEGSIEVRSSHTGTLVASLALADGLVDRSGAIDADRANEDHRTPRPVLADVLGDKAFAQLDGSRIITLYGDDLLSDLEIRGERINRTINALRAFGGVPTVVERITGRQDPLKAGYNKEQLTYLLQKGHSVDPLVKGFDEDSFMVGRYPLVHQSARRMVEIADTISLLRRCGVQHGRPLVQRSTDPAYPKIPGHLLKRATEARKNRGGEGSSQSAATNNRRIPEHLLERSKAAKQQEEGGR